MNIREEEIRRSHETHAIVSGVNRSFKAICAMKKLAKAVPYELRGLYRDWLISTYGYLPEDIPWAEKSADIPRGAYVKPGLKFPAPHGSLWSEMCGTFRSRQRQRSFDQDAFCAWLEERALAYEFGEQAVALRAAADPRKKFIKKAIAARDKQARDAAEGKPYLPKTLPEAFGLPDAGKWVESSEAEKSGLTDNQVVAHGYTLDQLKDLGVPVDPKLGRVKPIGMSVVLSHK